MTKNELLRETAKGISTNYDTAEIPMYGDRPEIPNRDAIIGILSDFRKLFFPAYFGEQEMIVLPEEEYAYLLMNKIYDKLVIELKKALKGEKKSEAEEIANALFEELPKIQELVIKDMRAIFAGDPAAASKEEIVLAYPGIYAIFVYRIAHALYQKNVPVIPRMMTEYAHSRTGIDINPGATIGEYFMIDHGTGIVIGETAHIGDHVQMYQGATLGALSPADGQELRGIHRHPTVGDNVTIYANATLLGGDTSVGNNTIIGGNAFITHSIIEGSKVSIKAPELTISQSKEEE